ncbi:MAG: alpha/beta fold hydrolase [Solirubrobacterales bacterium]|nr:alpha/beta fold hydrolase [Solirubrobacterales bacterium]
MPETLVLLHGFSGTHRAWDGVVGRLDPERYRPLAIDLPGHGVASDHPWPIRFEDCTRAVLAAAPERFALCGYSLGGRVALHVALAAPERVTRLYLIAANPGIEDGGERAARLAADERLAQRLEGEPFEQFIESWRTQPLFAADPPAVGELARADQRRNEPLALAAVMRGLSTGAMTPLWTRLGELEIPVALIAGERDEKFVALARRTLALLRDGSLSVLAGGHGLPLEDPGGVAAVLEARDPEPRG